MSSFRLSSLPDDLITLLFNEWLLEKNNLYLRQFARLKSALHRDDWPWFRTMMKNRSFSVDCRSNRYRDDRRPSQQSIESMVRWLDNNESSIGCLRVNINSLDWLTHTIGERVNRIKSISIDQALIPINSGTRSQSLFGVEATQALQRLFHTSNDGLEELEVFFHSPFLMVHMPWLNVLLLKRLKSLRLTSVASTLRWNISRLEAESIHFTNLTTLVLTNMKLTYAFINSIAVICPQLHSLQLPRSFIVMSENLDIKCQPPKMPTVEVLHLSQNHCTNMYLLHHCPNVTTVRSCDDDNKKLFQLLFSPNHPHLKSLELVLQLYIDHRHSTAQITVVSNSPFGVQWQYHKTASYSTLVSLLITLKSIPHPLEQFSFRYVYCDSLFSTVLAPIFSPPMLPLTSLKLHPMCWRDAKEWLYVFTQPQLRTLEIHSEADHWVESAHKVLLLSLEKCCNLHEASTLSLSTSLTSFQCNTIPLPGTIPYFARMMPHLTSFSANLCAWDIMTLKTMVRCFPRLSRISMVHISASTAAFLLNADSTVSFADIDFSARPPLDIDCDARVFASWDVVKKIVHELGRHLRRLRLRLHTQSSIADGVGYEEEFLKANRHVQV